MMLIVNVDRRTGNLVDEPEIISRGFAYLRDSQDLMETVKSAIQETLTSSSGQNGRRREKLQENIGRVLYNETRRRPMVFSVINER